MMDSLLLHDQPQHTMAIKQSAYIQLSSLPII